MRDIYFDMNESLRSRISGPELCRELTTELENRLFKSVVDVLGNDKLGTLHTHHRITLNYVRDHLSNLE